YQPLLDEAEGEFQIFGVGMFMHASHGDANGVQGMIDAIKIINAPLAVRAAAFATKLPTEIAYEDAKEFIRGLRSVPSEPQSTDPEEWLSLGEFLYWVHALGVGPGCPVR